MQTKLPCGRLGMLPVRADFDTVSPILRLLSHKGGLGFYTRYLHTQKGGLDFFCTPKREDSVGTLGYLHTQKGGLDFFFTPKREDSVVTLGYLHSQKGGLDFFFTPKREELDYFLQSSHHGRTLPKGRHDFYLSPPITGGHSQKGGTIITSVLPSWEDTPKREARLLLSGIFTPKRED